MDTAVLRQLEAAVEAAKGTEHGSGEHRVLESLLNSLGHIPNNPQEAVDIAERLISEWYADQSKRKPVEGKQKKLF